MSNQPSNSRKGGGGKRYYVWGKGERYWSVTTILNAYPKDALKFWTAKQVAEFAFDYLHSWMSLNRDAAIDLLKREPLRYTGNKAEIGTTIHAAAEAYVLKKPIGLKPMEEDVRLTLAQFLDWLRVVEPTFLATEATVYNRTQRYAGTLDNIVEVSVDRLDALEIDHPWEPSDGSRLVRLLGDYKSGGDFYEGKGIYPEVGLQEAAYARAEFIGAPDGSEQPMPKLDGAFALHLRPEGWRMIPVDALNENVYRSFLYVREVFRFREEIAKIVLGQPILRPSDLLLEKIGVTK